MAIFQDGGRRHLGFFSFLTVGKVRVHNYVTMPHFIEIARTAVEISQFVYFAKWRPTLFWIFTILNF